MSVLLRDVEVRGVRTSVRVAGTTIIELDPNLVATDDDELVIDGGGGALIPGLHDHHIHLAAMAAADRSLPLDGRDLDRSLSERHGAMPPGEWLRAVGYDERVHGPLDRDRLDALAPGRPVRVQHRSGALWVLSSAAVEQLGAPGDRLFRMDDWLRVRLPANETPDVAAVAARLARYGITGVTDATPSTSLEQLQLVADPLPIRVIAMIGVQLAASTLPRGVERGPVKLVIADHELPPLDSVVASILTAHERGLPVAVHCVTRVALVLALAAWAIAGVRAGDRIEHGSVISPDLAERVAQLQLTVVTQPAFIVARGDRYFAEVDDDDVPHLYRCASLIARGIDVGGSTDAPFGPEDPWVAVRAAIERQTSSGRVLGADERIAPSRALALFLTSPERPGGEPRQIAVGHPADACLLDEPLVEVLRAPSAQRVRAVMSDGLVTHNTST